MVQNPTLFNLEVQFGWLPENQTKNNLMVSYDLESTQVFRHQAVVNVDCVFINAVFGKQQHQLNKERVPEMAAVSASMLMSFCCVQLKYPCPESVQLSSLDCEVAVLS